MLPKWVLRVGILVGVFVAIVILGIIFLPSLLQLLPSQYQTLPSSSFLKKKIYILETGNYNIWRDGMFMYRQKADEKGNIRPYAVIGIVKNASDRFFEISPLPEIKSQFLFQPVVKVMLLETSRILESRFDKNGKLVPNSKKPISYFQIKPGEAVEFFELVELKNGLFSANSALAYYYER